MIDSSRIFSCLDELLWRERALLERLAYRLAAQHAVIAHNDDGRWLRMSDGEVSHAVGDLRRHEVLRAVETEQLLARLGQPADASLAELVELAPPPWSVILDEHRAQMRALEADIRHHAARTIGLLQDLMNGDPS